VSHAQAQDVKQNKHSSRKDMQRPPTPAFKEEEEGLQGFKAAAEEKKRGYRVCSSGYAATDTS
jgi:hypothetical protein